MRISNHNFDSMKNCLFDKLKAEGIIIDKNKNHDNFMDILKEFVVTDWSRYDTVCTAVKQLELGGQECYACKKTDNIWYLIIVTDSGRYTLSNDETIKLATEYFKRASELTFLK